MGSRAEILSTRYGEMLDLIDCDSIYEGTAVPKEKLSQEYVLFQMR